MKQSKLQKYINEKYQGKYKQHVYYPIGRNKQCDHDPYKYAYCCCMFKEDESELMASKAAYSAMEDRGVQPWAGASVKDETGVQTAIDRGAYLISRIAVMKEQRGKGLGGKIVKAAEDEIIKLGGKTAVIHAQLRVKEFYESLGYKAYGEIDLEEGVEHIMMKKELI